MLSPLTLVGAWKEFLWPMPVLPDADMQPLSVALPRPSDTAETRPLTAAMFISVPLFLRKA